MQSRVGLKLFYYLVIAFIVLLAAFWLYLNFSTPEYDMSQSAHVKQIESHVATQDNFSFAVVGNVNNSVRTFGTQIIPMINESDADFLISAGNAVSDGGEENYRSIYKVFSKLAIPFLFTFGENENDAFGNARFYEKIGPHFFDFESAGQHFIFLDSTGNTDFDWQLHWLRQQLSKSEATRTFVFIGTPLHSELSVTPPFEEGNYFPRGAIRDSFRALFEEFAVDVVFSSNLSLFHDVVENGVRYVTTGGAGGLILNHEDSYHHYVRVAVQGPSMNIEPVRFAIEESVLLRTLDSIWSAVYSFFYVSYVRFFLILLILVAISISLWQLLFEERNYYPDFDLDPTPFVDQKKRVAIFSNNFFPFISGVTISIDRLIRGLQEKGYELLVVAPDYDKKTQDKAYMLRVRTLFAFGQYREFRFANLLQPGVGKAVKLFNPDIIHLQHPFGLGSLGLWIARRNRIPAVYTYHTRLEMYAHYVPLPGAIFRNLISHVLVKRFCNKCDGIVVPTWSVEEYLRVIGVKTRILVQPTGIDYEAFQKVDNTQQHALREKYKIADEEKVLVTVSRLGKEKNIDFLIRAMADLPQYTKARCKLLIVGSGVEKKQLQELIVSFDLQDKVLLTGGVEPDMIRHYYHLADGFVFASKSETQGMVILEAMSAGLPVVAIRASGIDDVIEHGKNGYKTPENKEIWSRCLARLLDDDDLRATLSRQARLFAAEHDVSNFCSKINCFYAELLAARAQFKST
ncbi:glycosyl transferase family 1 [Aliidiomarina minuta]|uniref:Glycosyl transferase family 1 n=1 Tax=Aliidiomarina minuta TaxID=880057 RepID=A0A432W3G2_9GAMM|nr:glycosyltransferase [Aliidiomarina minuta]RUO23878.1 glycosyl transferase family 1 [Aliidiomarina minuta]